MVNNMIENRELTMDDYLAMVRRRLRVILIPALLAPIAGFLVSYAFPPKYSSQSLVLVEGQKVPDNYVQPVITSDFTQRLATMQQQVLAGNRLRPMIERLGSPSPEKREASSRNPREHDGGTRPSPIFQLPPGFLLGIHQEETKQETGYTGSAMPGSMSISVPAVHAAPSRSVTNLLDCWSKKTSGRVPRLRGNHGLSRPSAGRRQRALRRAGCQARELQAPGHGTAPRDAENNGRILSP